MVVRPQSHHAQPQPAMQSEESQAAAESTLSRFASWTPSWIGWSSSGAPSMDPQVWWGLGPTPRLDLLHRLRRRPAGRCRLAGIELRPAAGPRPENMSGRIISRSDWPERAGELGLDMIESGWQFLQQLADQLGAPSTKLPVELPLRIGFLPPAVSRLGLLLIQRLYLNIGDLLRFTESVFSGWPPTIAEARRLWRWSPRMVRTYHQLAVLANATKRRLDAVYYYMRSLAASHPYLASYLKRPGRRREAAWRQREAERSKRQRAKERRLFRADRSAAAASGRFNKPNRRCRVEVWVPVSGAGRQLSSGLLNSDEERPTCTATASCSRHRIGMESFQEACSQTLLELAAWLRHEPPALSGYFQLAAAACSPPAGPPARDRQERPSTDLCSWRAPFGCCAGLCRRTRQERRCLPLPEPHPGAPVLAEAAARLDGGVPRGVEPRAPTLQRDPHLSLSWTSGERPGWPACCTDCARFSPTAAEVRTPAVGDFEESKKPPISAAAGSCRLHVILQEDVFANASPPCSTDATPDRFSTSPSRRRRSCRRPDACAVFADYLSAWSRPLLGYSMEAGGAYFSQQLDKLASERMEDCQQPQPQPPSLEMSRMNPVPLRPTTRLAASAAADGIGSCSALESSGQRYMELEIVRINLLPDTNCYIHYLGEIRSLLGHGKHNLILPIVVLNELDHLAKHGDSSEHAGYVASQARAAVAMLEEAFESKAGGAARRRVKAVTAKAARLDTNRFPNDDLILSCCMNTAQDKASAFMPKDKTTVRPAQGHCAADASDRNLRLKAIGSNIPAKDSAGLLQPNCCLFVLLVVNSAQFFSFSASPRMVPPASASHRARVPRRRWHVQVRLLVQLSRARRGPGSSAGHRRPRSLPMRSRDCASCACSCVVAAAEAAAVRIRSKRKAAGAAGAARGCPPAPWGVCCSACCLVFAAGRCCCSLLEGRLVQNRDCRKQQSNSPKGASQAGSVANTRLPRLPTATATTASAVDEDGLVPSGSLPPTAYAAAAAAAAAAPPLAPSPMQSCIGSSSRRTPSAEASGCLSSVACLFGRDSAADGLHQRLLDGDRLVTTQRLLSPMPSAFRGGGGSSRRLISDPVPQPQIPPVGLAAEQLRKFRAARASSSRLRCSADQGNAASESTSRSSPHPDGTSRLRRTGEQRQQPAGESRHRHRRQRADALRPAVEAGRVGELQSQRVGLCQRTPKRESENAESEFWNGPKVVAGLGSPAFWAPAGPMLSATGRASPAPPPACTWRGPSCSSQQQRLPLTTPTKRSSRRLLGDLVAATAAAGVWLQADDVGDTLQLGLRVDDR
uniref:PINc domain-containing protein n=1 Tax=Macrostomum lignano TaxID=282301 RepID=A0A1I8FMQ3_9PLAT